MTSPEPVRPSILLRLLPIVGVVIGGFIVEALVFAIAGLLRGPEVLLAWSLEAVIFVVLGLVLLAISVSHGRTIAALGASGDLPFHFARSIGMPAAISAIPGAEQDVASARWATAGASGLSFWNREHEVATLPWTSVADIEYARVHAGRGTNPSITVTFRGADGPVALPLSNSNARSFALASTGEVKWIIARLDALRA